jgi:general stress protein 26
LRGRGGWGVTKEEGRPMLEKMKDIVKGNDLCVLATVSEGKPHCSLMSYISDEEGHEVYLISHKQTKKYVNLMKNPTVSLLIDTREKEKGQRRIYIKGPSGTSVSNHKM